MQFWFLHNENLEATMSRSCRIGETRSAYWILLGKNLGRIRLEELEEWLLKWILRKGVVMMGEWHVDGTNSWSGKIAVSDTNSVEHFGYDAAVVADSLRLPSLSQTHY
jgi:hypothetical protein